MTELSDARGRRVTMAEIAAAAEVSVPTVSKVLNGRFDVAAETRQRVEDALTASGYARGRRGRAEAPRVLELGLYRARPVCLGDHPRRI